MTTIPSALRAPQPTPPDADFATLRAEALERIQQTQQDAARPWTDHNLHDPGITLMEAALYALADVHYRIAARRTDAWSAETDDWRGRTYPFGRHRREALRAALADPTAQACVDRATSLADATARLMAEVPGAQPAAVARALARVLHEPVLRRAALDHSHTLEASADETQLAAALDGLGVWPEELNALAALAARHRLARFLHEQRAEIVRRVNAGTSLAASFTDADGRAITLSAADQRVALAAHPCPPDTPELWEDDRGETTLWPPHPLQARTVEPVTAGDYRRLALAVPEVKRAFVLRGRAAGLDWKGDETAASRPFRRGASTLVFERAGVEPPRCGAPLDAGERDWLRTALNQALGRTGPAIQYPDFRAFDEAELDLQEPRRLLGDEIGATYLRSFGVIVRAVVEIEPSALVGAVREDARAQLRAFLSSDRTLPLEPAPPAPRPLRCPQELDGPWPASAAVPAFLADPRGEAAERGWTPGAPVRASEVAQLLQSIRGVAGITGLALRREDQPATTWTDTLNAPPEHAPYCVPAFAEAPDCLVVRVNGEETCPGA